MSALRLLPVLVVLMVGVAQAQLPQRRLFQLSGLVMDGTDQSPLGFVRVSVNGSRRGAFANEYGFFSLPVEATDTLHFRRVGYAAAKLAVADVLAETKPEGEYMYTLQELTPEGTVLPPTEVYPYRNAFEARMALLNMPIPSENSIEQVAGNITPELLGALAATLPADVQDQLSAQDREYLAYYASRGFRPYVPVISSESFTELVHYVAKRSEERKKRVYSYWGTDR